MVDSPKSSAILSDRLPRPEETGGRFAKSTDRIPARVANDLTSDRVRDTTRDPSQLHGVRVGECRMPTRMSEEYGVVRRDSAERCMGRQPVHVRLWTPTPLFLVPATTGDQLPGLGLPNRIGDHAHNLIPSRYVHQVQLQR